MLCTATCLGEKMEISKLVRTCVLATGLAATGMANAGVFSASLPEFNGNGANGTESWGTLTFSIPLGESAVSAVLSGVFGNSQNATTSVHSVFADGILVASCPNTSALCWGSGPNPWSYTFSGAELSIFNDGMVVMTTTQTDCCVVREGALSLRGTTDASSVPEPSAMALALAGLLALRSTSRRRRI